jgi:hypothetical protein
VYTVQFDPSTPVGPVTIELPAERYDEPDDLSGFLGTPFVKFPPAPVISGATGTVDPRTGKLTLVRDKNATEAKFRVRTNTGKGRTAAGTFVNRVTASAKDQTSGKEFADVIAETKVLP